MTGKGGTQKTRKGFLKRKPKGAHYYNEGDGTYIKINYDVVYEWKGNHWDRSSLDLSDIDSLISLNMVKPLFAGLLASTLVTIFQIAVIAATVGFFVWYVK